MKHLFKTALGICLFQKGPEDLPYSLTALIMAFSANALLTIFQFSIQKPVSDALWQGLLIVLLTMFYCYLILFLRGRGERFVQTAMALMLTGFMLSLLLMPIVFINPIFQPVVLPNFLKLILSVLVIAWLLLLQIWSVLVYSHIFRRSLDLAFFYGLLITLGLVGIEIIVVTKLNF